MTSFIDALLPLLHASCAGGGILSFHAVLAQPGPSPEMHVSERTLEQQLRFVCDSYDVVSLRELLARHRARRSLRRLVAITFDDAYAGVERHAFPVLRALGIPATLFVTVAYSLTRRSYWWDAVEGARHEAQEGSSTRWAAILDELGVPALPPTPRSAALIREHVLAVHAGVGPEILQQVPLPSDLHALSVADLQRVATEHDYLDFGCHTLTHPALPLISPVACEHELRASLQRLRDELPRVVPAVAYPYGLYDTATAEIARCAGFTAGVTLQGRALRRSDDPMMLPRIGVAEHRTTRSIALRLNAGLRPLMIARTGSAHPAMPTSPFARHVRHRVAATLARTVT